MGVNTGMLPVTRRGSTDGAGSLKLRRAAGVDLEDDALARDKHDDTLACERCDRDKAEPELGLGGKRKWRGGRSRSDEREEGCE